MIYIVILLALVGIVLGAEWLVSGSASIAKRFRVSEFVIGAVIVGIGTSMPELTVSTIGAIAGNSDVAIGNVVGSNIFNILGILGITALVCPIPIDRKNMWFEIPLCIIVSILLLLIAMNFFNGSQPVIGRIDGLLLLAFFVLFVWYSLHRDRKETEHEKFVLRIVEFCTETKVAYSLATEHLCPWCVKHLTVLPDVVLEEEMHLCGTIDLGS